MDTRTLAETRARGRKSTADKKKVPAKKTTPALKRSGGKKGELSMSDLGKVAGGAMKRKIRSDQVRYLLPETPPPPPPQVDRASGSGL